MNKGLRLSSRTWEREFVARLRRYGIYLIPDGTTRVRNRWQVLQISDEPLYGGQRQFILWLSPSTDPISFSVSFYTQGNGYWIAGAHFTEADGPFSEETIAFYDTLSLGRIGRNKAREAIEILLRRFVGHI